MGKFVTPVHIETTIITCINMNLEVKSTKTSLGEGKESWVGVLTLLILPVISRKLGREMSTKSRCSQQEYIDIHTHTHIHINTAISSQVC